MYLKHSFCVIFVLFIYLFIYRPFCLFKVIFHRSTVMLPHSIYYRTTDLGVQLTGLCITICLQYVSLVGSAVYSHSSMLPQPDGPLGVWEHSAKKLHILSLIHI